MHDIRVAFILPSLANRGPIIFTKYLIVQLVKLVKYVKVFYFDDINDVEFPCDCERICFWSKEKFEGFDIVHSTMFRPDLFVIKNKINKLTISGLHNYIGDDMVFNYGKVKGRVLSISWLHILRYFDACVLSSLDMVDYYDKNASIKKKVIIPYGISKVEYNSTTRLPCVDKLRRLKNDNKIIIGAVGLLIYRKGFHQIIKALTALKNHALLIVGDGPEKENLLALAKKLGVDDRVVVPGFSNQSAQYYQYIDIYCLCSYSEGFGLAMLEALSVGLPLVCSNLPIYKEYFTNNDVALFELDDIGGLVLAIEKVSSGVDYFGHRSLELFERYFSARVMAERHVEFYCECLNKDY